MIKKVLSIALACVVVFAVSGCKSNNTAANASTKSNLQKPIVIGWCPPAVTGVFKTAQDYMQKAVDGANAAGLNVKIITQAPAAETDVNAQVSIIENFVQSKVSALVISATQTLGIVPALKEANAANIPIIMVNTLSPIQGVKVTAFVGFDNQESASVAAYSALNALGGPGVLPTGKIIPTKKTDRLNLAWWQNVYKTVDKSSIKGNVAIINGVAGDFFAVNRGIGFHSVIDQYPGIKVVATKYADWTRAEAETDAENILQNNPSLNLIWCASSEMECGAITAVTNAGRENQVKVVGNDGTPETVGLITQGKLLAETWHGFPEWGWYGAEITVELALGETVQQKYDIDPRVEYKGNADQFYPNPNLLPINWKTIIANAKT